MLCNYLFTAFKDSLVFVTADVFITTCNDIVLPSSSLTVFAVWRMTTALLINVKLVI